MQSHHCKCVHPEEGQAEYLWYSWHMVKWSNCGGGGCPILTLGNLSSSCSEMFNQPRKVCMKNKNISKQFFPSAQLGTCRGVSSGFSTYRSSAIVTLITAPALNSRLLLS